MLTCVTQLVPLTTALTVLLDVLGRPERQCILYTFLYNVPHIL